MRYRLYHPADFAALYAIEEVCFEPPFRFGRLYMRGLVNARHSATWIAEDGGRMAGFAIVEWTARGKTVSAYLQTIEVLPEFRVQGVGQELLARTEYSARKADALVLWLHVDESNAAAIRLYERQGFTAAGKEEHYYAEGRGALLYRKELTE